MTRWSATTVAVLLSLAACTDDRVPVAPSTTDAADAPGLPPGLAFEGGPGPTGAIFTTVPDGSIVNENVRYNSKLEVYLDGGPRGGSPQTAAGLDDGLYVFQITDPSGKYLLSMDPSKCRIVEVGQGVIKKLVKPSDLDLYGLTELTNTYTVGNGQNPTAYPCHVADAPTPPATALKTDFGPSGRHDTNVDVDYGANGAIVVQMMPYGTTPNPGGVYKAWVTPISTYLSRSGSLTVAPSQLSVGQQRPHRCPDFCAAADAGFGPPRSVQKTDNFKVREEARVRVVKVNDLDGDGVRDAGEPEIAGWRVAFIETLFDQTEAQSFDVTPATRTFEPGAAIQVCEEKVANWLFTFATGGTSGTPTERVLTDGRTYLCIPVTVGAASTIVEIAFGNFERGTKSGLKFHDLNANAVRNLPGDVGLGGWTINLINAAGQVAATTTTASNGSYSFTGLGPGTYRVCETLQANWYQSYPKTGTTPPAGETLVTNCDAINAGFGKFGYQFTVTSGAAFTGDDFGNYQNATKSGVKFEDEDGDGAAREYGEALLGGWEIHLFGTAGTGAAVHLHTTTAPTTGAYSFSVPPGTYWVCETQQTGWTQSYPKSGVTDAGACPAHAAGGGTPAGAGAASGWGYNITLVSQQVDANNDFGNFRPAQLTGVKFSDANGNSVRDAGEGGLQGFEIHLSGTSGLGAAVHRHSTTDANGAYSFTNVPPGLYKLCEGQKAGFIQRFPVLGVTANAFDCSTLTLAQHDPVFPAPNAGYGLALGSGDNVTSGFDFGNQPTQGCTPGFWKQDQHFGFWTSPYTPSTTFKTAFSAYNGQGGYPLGITMLQALALDNSTGIGQVMRHGTAALLNSLRSDIAFGFTPPQVQTLVNSALLSSSQSFIDGVHAQLAFANERGCPIGGQNPLGGF